MTGVVNENLEAAVELHLRTADGSLRRIAAVIDTGFNGFLTLPLSSIQELNLAWLCRQQGHLADGSLHTFDVYVATVEWDGSARIVEVEEAEAQPLLGMAMMIGSELRIEVMPGGKVRLTPVSTFG